METRWRIELFGGLRATWEAPAREGDGRVLTRFRTRKTGSLLAYLVCHLAHAHPREALIEVLWPGADPTAGSNRLSVELSWLRHQLEPTGVPPGSILVVNRASVRLDPNAIATDIAELEAALHAAARAVDDTDRARWLTTGVDLYRGEFLPGYYESWVLERREWLAESYFRALGELLVFLEREGDLHRALDYAHQGVLVDPLHEGARRDLMRLYAAVGQPEAALRQYDELQRLLERELHAEPSSTTRDLAESIREGASGTLHPTPGALVAPLPQVLPIPLTRFFGREEEIARLRTMLVEERRRLVTLTGPGGSGKTRLALELGKRLAETVPFDAVWFVPLADLTDARLIVTAIRDAVSLPRSPGTEPEVQVVIALNRQPTLLLLDNLEQLGAEGAAVVERLLRCVPTLVCLVTSRRRLHLAGEREFVVHPLPVPEADCQRITASPSVELFVDRAQAVCPDFRMTDKNAAAVAALCRGLEGIPLALELAAARAAVLTPWEILTRLERRLDLLVSRDPSVAPRHRGLRAALGWSFRLLAPELQHCLARLSVFRGGWTLDAAAHVCLGSESRATGHGSREVSPSGRDLETLELLERLRHSSLIIAEEVAALDSTGRDGEGTPRPAGSEMRFRMLETVREYASERLGSEAKAAAERRHAGYYLALSERVGLELRKPDQRVWMGRLEQDLDNLRAALDWSEAESETETGLRLGAALGAMWYVRGSAAEGRERLARLLSHPTAAPRTSARARALHAAGDLALHQSDWETARTLCTESLSTFRELDDAPGTLGVLVSLGWVAQAQDDLGALLGCFEEGLALARQVGDRMGIAECLQGLACHARARGDAERAVALCRESLDLCRQAGVPANTGWALLDLGHALRTVGDLEAARALYEESLEVGKLGHKEISAHSLLGIGLVARVLSDRCAARSYLEAALLRFQELGNWGDLAAVLEGLAAVAIDEKEPGRAVRLFAAAARLRDATQTPILAPDRAKYEENVAAARAGLDEAAYAAAWGAGRGMTLQQAIACALHPGGSASEPDRPRLSR